MDKLGIEKTKQAIEDSLIVYEDVQKALEDDNKISLMEGGVLAVKHSGKAIRLITSIREIGKEIVDLDSAEAAELTQMLTAEFGGSEAAKDAIGDIAKGSGYLNQGIQKLIALKKG